MDVLVNAIVGIFSQCNCVVHFNYNLSITLWQKTGIKQITKTANILSWNV